MIISYAVLSRTIMPHAEACKSLLCYNAIKLPYRSPREDAVQYCNMSFDTMHMCRAGAGADSREQKQLRTCVQNLLDVRDGDGQPLPMAHLKVRSDERYNTPCHLHSSQLVHTWALAHRLTTCWLRAGPVHDAAVCRQGPCPPLGLR